MIYKAKETDITVVELGRATTYPCAIDLSENTLGICFKKSKESMKGSVVFPIFSLIDIVDYAAPLISVLDELEKKYSINPTANEEREAIRRDIANLKNSLDRDIKPFLKLANKIIR